MTLTVSAIIKQLPAKANIIANHCFSTVVMVSASWIIPTYIRILAQNCNPTHTIFHKTKIIMYNLCTFLQSMA